MTLNRTSEAIPVEMRKSAKQRSENNSNPALSITMSIIMSWKETIDLKQNNKGKEHITVTMKEISLIVIGSRQFPLKHKKFLPLKLELSAT